MIHSIIKTQQALSIIQGEPKPENDRDIVWFDINSPTVEESAMLRQRFGIDLNPKNSRVTEDNSFLYIRCYLLTLGADEAPYFGHVTFILGPQFVATLSSEEDFYPSAMILQRLNRKKSNTASPKEVLRILLQAANDNADTAIDRIADELERSAQTISEISEGYDAQGKELGVTDLLITMRSLNETEELISRCVEAQLTLARAVRYLSGEVDNAAEAELQVLVNELAGDVAAVKEHAYFEHQKMHYLQNAVTNILNIKQTK